jgi:hypothetical protein
MHSATLSLGRQLDMLYGLYMLALDLCRGIAVDDDEIMSRALIERQRLLRKTAAIADEAQAALRVYEEMPGFPANEQALITEKRHMILDVLGRLSEAENTMLKAMHTRMVGVRHELVRMDSRKRAINAYGQMPAMAA